MGRLVCYLNYSKGLLFSRGYNLDRIYPIVFSVKSLKQKKAESPKEFWDCSKQSKAWYLKRLTNLYLHEIGIQLRYAILCYENYLIAKNETDTEVVFLHIHHFLIHTANVDKLLDKLLNPSTSLKARLVNQILNLNGIELKSFRKARNHLEHFGERLDSWFYLYADSPILDLNLVNVETLGLSEESSLRLLRTDEDIFVILGERFDLGNLFDQVRLFSERIKALLDGEA